MVTKHTDKYKQLQQLSTKDIGYMNSIIGLSKITNYGSQKRKR